MLDKLKNMFPPLLTLSPNDRGSFKIDLEPATLKGGRMRTFDSIVLQKVSEQLPPFNQYTPQVWAAILKKKFFPTSPGNAAY